MTFGEAETSTGVLVWWAGLCVAAVVNVALWWWVRGRARRGWSAFDEPTRRLRRWQLWLAFGYVLVCAFRSVLPRADVQRIVLVDTFWSSVLVGRSVATVGELCFMAEAALFLYECGRNAQSRRVVALSRALVPLIAVAETCSWYAVVSTNYLGNTCEESLWAISAALLLLGFVWLWPRRTSTTRKVLLAAFVCAPAYLAFMLTVDIPMYFNRWRADQAAGRAYLSAAEGFHDLATRWVVTFAWADWHTEMPWLTGYFTFAVWLSLTMVLAPRAFTAK